MSPILAFDKYHQVAQILMPREARRMASGCTAGPTDPCALAFPVFRVLPRWLRVVFRVENGPKSLVDSVE